MLVDVVLRAQLSRDRRGFFRHLVGQNDDRRQLAFPAELLEPAETVFVGEPEMGIEKHEIVARPVELGIGLTARDGIVPIHFRFGPVSPGAVGDEILDVFGVVDDE